MNRDPSSQIESLLKLAGERDQPSQASVERARAAAEQSWRRGLRADASGGARRPRLRLALAMAASVIAVITAAFWLRTPQQPAVDVARVSAVVGDARLAESGAVVLAAVMRSGDMLTTGSGRVALAVGDVLSLRVDRDSRLRFDGAGQVTLLEGSVYVDSGGLNAHTALRIDTPAGAVRHVGTQFQVQVRAELTRVQVREGRVMLTQGSGASLDLAAGDLAEVTGTRVRVEHDQPHHGATWEWAAIAAPEFDVENRPLSEFLAWLAREHGWQVKYADDATQARAQDIRLHGALTGLDAGGMLERTAMITGVPLAVNDGSLLVGPRP